MDLYHLIVETSKLDRKAPSEELMRKGGRADQGEMK